MKIPITVFLSAIAIAAGIAYGNHYQLVGSRETAFRLNTWTGEVSFCIVNQCRRLPNASGTWTLPNSN